MSLTASANLNVEFDVRVHQARPRYVRIDIQALRGLAIILVLAHHASFPYLPAGFLGVDIFFVISGFLMTGLIDEALIKNDFSFFKFYVRRAKRLLPAAYATLIVTAIIAPVLLDALEYDNFVYQLAGSFTFVSNFVLWKQSDYFSSSAALKPLLHIWSLSVEEQFYIVLPAIMWFCPVRARLPLGIVLVAVSAALCLYFMQRTPSAAFYFLPTRAWELGLGSVVALAVRRGIIKPASMPLVRLGCLAVIAAVSFLATESGHPGWAAILVCLSTAVLMIPGAEMGRLKSSLVPVTMIGDRSYSLYLVHWPVFAFANHIFINPVPGYVNAVLLIVCMALAEIQYRFVEQRFRSAAFTWKPVAVLALVPIIVIGSSFMWARMTRSADAFAREGNYGLSPKCDYRGAFTELPECQSKPAVNTLVWGDSFAMALVNGMLASTPGGLVQATQTLCGPFLGLAPLDAAQYPRSRAEGCIHFNQSVADFLSRHPEIDTVVLSSALAQYISGAENKKWWALDKASDSFIERPQSVSLLMDGLERTVASLRAMGKRVVLFAPPPSLTFDIGRCLDRTTSGKPTILPYPDCTFTRSEYQAVRRPILEFIEQVNQRGLVPVISIDEHLCASGTCQTRLEGTILYRDRDHLSAPGSTLLGKRQHWGEWVRDVAR
jgi:peptidoglycan/LPS O-acetylase OafA/YrhL